MSFIPFRFSNIVQESGKIEAGARIGAPFVISLS